MACSFVNTAVNLLCLSRQKSAIIFVAILGFACPYLPANALAQSTPTITTVQWDPSAVGGTQCANGSGFGSGGGTISLNGASVTPSLWSDTQVCATIPTGTTGGPAVLQITTSNGPSNTQSFTVTTLVPSVIGVTPASAGAGAQVTIAGTNFGAAQNDSTVQLRGQTFQIASWSDTQIVATVPSGIPAGGVYSLDITVHGFTTSGGLSIVGIPQATSVQWAPLAAGGTQCVNGTGFDSVAGTINLNGSVLAPSLWSGSQVCFVAPAATPAGPAIVQVVNGAGSSNPVSFMITTLTPSVAGISPASAGAGAPVTISGTNFGATQGAGFVQLQGQSLLIVSWSNTQIVATIPAGIPPGALYSINVTVNGVTVTTGLTIVSPPQISSIQWDPVALGGNQCAFGSGFGSAAGTVILNSLGLTPSLWSDTLACAAVPASTPTGAATLQVTNGAGASNTAGFAVTANVPAMTGVSPSSAGAGTQVTITGVNFGNAQGASFVQLRGQNFGIVRWSDTQITATVPAGIPAGGVYSVDVTVSGLTVSGGLSIVGVPQVASVQWDPIAPGGTQCATGAGFGQAAGSLLLNGLTLAPSLWSDSRACVTIPANATAGTATLQIINGAGAGNALTFTVTAVSPVVTGVTPVVSGSGLPVTITGANFGATQGNGTVQLRGQLFGIVNWSDTQISATVPAGIPPGGVYSVDVTAFGFTASGGLTIVPLPQISSLTPPSGTPGTSVILSGQGFGDFPGAVSFGGIQAAVAGWSDTSITVAVPAGAFTGNVAVTTRTSLLSNALNFSVLSGNPSLDSSIVSRIATIDSSRISQNMQTLANFGTRNTCSSNAGGTSGIGAARDFILAQFAALPGVQTSLFNFSTTSCGLTRTVQDVVAWIPGSGHPNRLIVIGGHYDSRTVNVVDGASSAPGANDSGSQTSVVMEAARVLAGSSYDATIVFVAWAGEEQGLLGSAAFVQNFRTLFPQGTIEFNLNCDIVGGDNTANTAANLQQFRLFSPGTPREISTNAIGSTDNTSPSRLIMHFIGDWASRYVPEMAMLPNLREDRPGRGGDHESFIAGSIPGVRFIDPVENLAHEHTASDLFSFTTPDYAARIARLIVSTAAALAQAPTPPQTFTATLINNDTIKAVWSAPRSGPRVDHYVIAARPVTENFYRTRVEINGSQTSSQVRINEDLGIAPGASFFVSVGAVDAAGHESIFAYPEFRCTATACVIPTGALNVTATR